MIAPAYLFVFLFHYAPIAQKTILEKRQLKGLYDTIFFEKLIQWNLYQADTFGTFPSVRLMEVKIAQCLFMISIQRLLCTVIKFHVVKEAKEAVLYFVQDF